MKIAAIKERAENENRTAISPETTKLLVKKGCIVLVEWGIGEGAGFSDQSYVNAGASLSADPSEIVAHANIILKVQPTPLSSKFNEIHAVSKDTIIVGLLAPYHNKDYIDKMRAKQLHGVAMELLPRITKTQNMDVLSSQSNLAGYRAVIEAVYQFGRILPMMMTAAGTLSPAKLLVIGVGVAGLQAIATARRLGAIVSAYDVRSSTKEQVESLGAKFVMPEIAIDNMEDKSGYAKSVSDSDKAKQEQFLASIIKNYDIIITTAQIPGRSAPRLITAEMINTMKDGSVIVDMATSSGGNVEGSELDKIILHKNVKIIGWSNLASKVATDSSTLYAKNLYNFLEYAIKDGQFNFSDDIIKQMLVTNL